MPHKGVVPPKVKLEAVKGYLAGNGSIGSIAKKLGINKGSLKAWLRLYNNRGAHALDPSSTKKSYTKAFKETVIQDYIQNGLSLNDICSKYDISQPVVVRRWLEKYNNRVELKDKDDGGDRRSMINRRKTTVDERIKIVRFCLENGKNYHKASEEYQVSYHQIYAWVKKYEKSGVQGLEDRRGKIKQENAITREDILKSEITVLTAKLKRAEMENELLKKVQEVERGRR